MKCENYKQYNVLCQTCDYPNKITCNKTFEENTKMQEDVVMKDEFMILSKKEKSKILVKHLERDFELVSRCGETYVIMSIMDALSEIESLEGERSEPMSTPYATQGWLCHLCGRVNAPTTMQCPCYTKTTSGADSTDFRDDPNRETQAEYFGKK